MKMHFQVAVLFIAVLMIGCDKDVPVANLYEGCCSNVPVEFSITNSEAHIYVPNVFTPNADGINDLFYPVFNDYILYLNHMVITQHPDEGPPILYQVHNVDVKELWMDKYWNGRNQEGKIHKGKFTFEISLETTDDKSILIHGFGCSVLCDDDAQLFNTITNCFFATQSDDGYLDPTLANHESGCFH